LLFQFCPYCGRKTPEKNFCVYCGKQLSNTNICLYCHSPIPMNATSCPFCGFNGFQSRFNNTLEDFSYLNWVCTNLRLAIFVIFLLSTYSLTQLMVGFVFIIFFSADFIYDNANFPFFSLVIMLVSSVILIVIINKWLIFSSGEKPPKIDQVKVLFLLLIVLIASISIIEILVTLTDFGLDLINVDPSLSSPYDDFFRTPLNILAFTILVTIIGPIFEELVFRHFAISMMLKQCQSKIFIISTSALIFSLSHTATNLLESLRYTILHMVATFSIGVILGIIFLRWGLKYAIIFHSFWNLFSLVVQLLIIYESVLLIDLILLVSMAITFILTVYFLFSIRTSLRRIISEITLPTRRELLLILVNFFLILTYELFLPLILLTAGSNFLTAGFTFLYQFCGFSIGLMLINRE